MPILTSAQVAAMQRALSAANQVLPRLEMLEQLAQVNPGLRQRVSELRAQREYLYQLAMTALELDRQVGSAPSYSPPPPASPMVANPVSGVTPCVNDGGGRKGPLNVSKLYFAPSADGCVKLPSAEYRQETDEWEVRPGNPSYHQQTAASFNGYPMRQKDNGMWIYESNPFA
jgi:hypothetical protein